MSHVVKFNRPTHRPWKIREVPVGKLVRNHAWPGEKEEGIYLIVGADSRGCLLGTEWITFEDMLEYYVMEPSGSACGGLNQ